MRITRNLGNLSETTLITKENPVNQENIVFLTSLSTNVGYVRFHKHIPLLVFNLVSCTDTLTDML